MAKGTNSSRCPEVDRDFNRRISSIRSDKFRTNDGFKFQISVVHSGVELSRSQISYIAHCCTRLVHQMIERYFLEDCDPDQLEFDF